MTKAGKIVLAVFASLLCGSLGHAQEAMAQDVNAQDANAPKAVVSNAIVKDAKAPETITPASAAPAACKVCTPALPTDDPTPFSASPFLFREFASDLPSTFPDFTPPADSGPPTNAGPMGPRRILPFVDVEIGYAMVFYKKQALFLPTLTAGNPTDPVPGAFGGEANPGGFGGVNTTWLFQRPNNDGRPVSAGRFRVATWLPEHESLSVEAIALVPDTQTIRTITSSASMPGVSISRPFFNPITGLNDAFPVAVNNLFSSVSNDAFKTHFYGGEANARYNFQGNCTALLGVRYLRVDESYYNQDNITNLIDGTFSSFRDVFSTTNRFVGPQIGILYNTGKNSWFDFDFFAKCAIGYNRQTIQIAGSSFFVDPVTGNSFIDPTKGSYAQPTNIGRYTRENISTIPECGVNFHLHVGPRCKVGVNYSGLLFTDMARPSGQIDYVINPQNLLGSQIPPNSPSPPQFNHTTFWMQTIAFSVEYVF